MVKINREVTGPSPVVCTNGTTTVHRLIKEQSSREGSSVKIRVLDSHFPRLAQLVRAHDLSRNNLKVKTVSVGYNTSANIGARPIFWTKS